MAVHFGMYVTVATAHYMFHIKKDKLINFMFCSQNCPLVTH